MAAGDYRSCDVCGGKAFYDANLSYEDCTSEWAKHREPYRIAGAEQYDKPELMKYAVVLGYVGDWAVICNECAKTHMTQIVRRPSKEGDAMGNGG